MGGTIAAAPMQWLFEVSMCRKRCSCEKVLTTACGALRCGVSGGHYCVLRRRGAIPDPQFDFHVVHDIHSHFLQLAEHFNAEAVAGTIGCCADAVDYLTWTFLFRRLLANPSYYDLEGTDADSVNLFLSGLVEDTLADLEVRHSVAPLAI